MDRPILVGNKTLNAFRETLFLIDFYNVGDDLIYNGMMIFLSDLFHRKNDSMSPVLPII